MRLIIMLCLMLTIRGGYGQETILLEAESFENRGGWVVDQQFIHLMGSSYLLAHGMGEKVENASTSFNTSATATFHVWVRTKDWVPDYPEHPGRFQVAIDGNVLSQTFGLNDGWQWVNGGTVELNSGEHNIELIDLTGFDGRCDAIYLTTNAGETPPNNVEEQRDWRNQRLNIAAVPPVKATYDVVIIGGGMAGCCAAIAAAREGVKVALVQDRPVLGGNNSEEVRVHSIGMPGPRIVSEINGSHYPNGSDEAVPSSAARKEIIDQETNITQYLSCRAFGVNKEGRRILSVDVKNTISNEEFRLNGTQFIDCTGDGWIGYWAGNRFMIGRESSEVFDESLAPTVEDNMMMGSTVMFNSKTSSESSSFPEVPWALQVSKDYAATSGEWFWEYGIGLDPFSDAEDIRDHLLRAIYGSFYNAKQSGSNATRRLNWVGYVAGKRESRRLIGEHILTENDVRQSVDFNDGVVAEQREIDLHLPKSDVYDFLSKALFTHIELYHIPFRCFIAADLDNLMMAGRCFSCSHVGLGSPRVMNTCGQMGVAVGCAAALCDKYSVDPRVVHSDHLNELKELVGIDTLAESGVILDNTDSSVEIIGEWTSSSHTGGYYGSNYIHDGNTGKGEKSVVFNLPIEESGLYHIYTKYTTGDSRSTKTPFVINHQDGSTEVLINQKENNGMWVKLGTFSFDAADNNTVTVSNENTDGHVIVDAISIVKDIQTSIGLDMQEGALNIESYYCNSGQVVFDCVLGGGNKTIMNIYSLTGRKVCQIDCGYMIDGNHEIIWDGQGKNAREKVYIAQLCCGKKTAVLKFVAN
ncbi:FAD-dependent oxidoreductase [Puteibacter caeruleilacunae]|nr:FAD-dependent oxidoreductase [Puteibacter caeruleilacunae]